MKKFEGFKPETIDFMWELRMNNSKEWMDANRERYKEVLKEPFDVFAAELAELSPMFCGEKSKYSVSRINRDIRYSKDKSPYRPNRWVVLYDEKFRGTEWKLHPSFYFELDPEGYTHGLGMWCATPSFLTAYRKKNRKQPCGVSETGKEDRQRPSVPSGGGGI